MADVRFSSDLAINGARQVMVWPINSRGDSWFAARFGPGVRSVTLDKAEAIATKHRLEAADITHETEPPPRIQDGTPVMLRKQA